MATSGDRGVDFLITYRIVKLLSIPFKDQDAYKLGIIDEKGNVLKKYRTLKTTAEKKAYTLLHRFVFNLKRILQKFGLGSRLGSFGVSLALLIKENKDVEKHKTLIESAVISYLKETNQYNEILNESKDIVEINATPYINCFGVDVYEINGELVSEFDYAKYKV